MPVNLQESEPLATSRYVSEIVANDSIIAEISIYVSIFDISIEEAIDMYIYENEFCETDELAKDFLLNHSIHPMTLKEIEAIFNNDIIIKMERDEVKSNPEYIRMYKQEISEYIYNQITKSVYRDIFINATRTSRGITFTCPETGQIGFFSISAGKEQKIKYGSNPRLLTVQSHQLRLLTSAMDRARYDGVLDGLLKTGLYFTSQTQDKKFKFINCKLSYSRAEKEQKKNEHPPTKRS